MNVDTASKYQGHVCWSSDKALKIGLCFSKCVWIPRLVGRGQYWTVSLYLLSQLSIRAVMGWDGMGWGWGGGWWMAFSGYGLLVFVRALLFVSMFFCFGRPRERTILHQLTGLSQQQKQITYKVYIQSSIICVPLWPQSQFYFTTNVPQRYIDSIF